MPEFADTPFEHALAALVNATGHTGDLTDEHGRWRLYERSYRELDLLHAALQHEPDQVMMKSVVLQVLRLVDGADHERWLELLPGDEYVRRRSREISLLRRAGALSPEEIDLEAWSDWLQLELAEVREPVLLRALAEGGRTKRIRRNATATLRGLG